MRGEEEEGVGEGHFVVGGSVLLGLLRFGDPYNRSDANGLGSVNIFKMAHFYLQSRSHCSSIYVNSRVLSISPSKMSTSTPPSFSASLSHIPDASLRDVLTTLSSCIHSISELCREGHTHAVSTTNAFGDSQLALDVSADNVLLTALRGCASVRIASSEETPEEVLMNPSGKYCVAFDPLDGSSILPCNWAVGTIIGIWESSTLVGASGKELCAVMVAVYGPRTTMYVAGREGGVGEYVMRGKDWLMTNKEMGIGDGVRVFAPGNLRATRKMEQYRALVEWYRKEGYTLRYSGGMVPDVVQLLVKGGGVFMTPVASGDKSKLRVIYEVMPLAFLVEKAGGASVDMEGRGVLERRIDGCEDRCGVCLGSEEEVKRFIDVVLKKGNGEN